jgi:uncharacterized protein related to proFAR isomerase
LRRKKVLGEIFEHSNILMRRNAFQLLRPTRAGGVRNVEDLLQLKQLGVAGVLVASALHNGTIKNTDIEKLMG